MPKVGVVLSGCGVKDGSEIHEAVAVLLAIDRAGAEAVCLAPNKDQMHVVDHLTDKPVPGEKRNVLVESARIARGQVKDMARVKAADLDALVFPGGFGAAKNLSTFATEGDNCQVDPQVARLTREMVSAGKPVGLACIAPVVAAKLFGDTPALRPTVTIGNDAGTAAMIEKMGGHHRSCGATEVVVDREHRIVTTPAYMLATRISQVFDGIDRMVREVVALTR